MSFATCDDPRCNISAEHAAHRGGTSPLNDERPDTILHGGVNFAPAQGPAFAPGKCPSCGHDQHIGRTCDHEWRQTNPCDPLVSNLMECGCPPERAIKASAGKVKGWRMFPWEVMAELLGIYEYGISKGYLRDSWRFVAPEEYEAALMRHATAILRGETHDPESKKRHIAHVAWNAITLMVLT
jgi:hypothetical protein